MTKELRLTELQGRGRSLVAAQPLKSGQIVLRDSPILLYSALPLLTPSPPPYCDHCFKTLNPQTPISLCPSCSHHRFCSPNCLSAALSSSHTPWVCQSLAKLRNCPSPLSAHPADRQVQARFLIAAYNLALEFPAAANSPGRTAGLRRSSVPSFADFDSLPSSAAVLGGAHGGAAG